MAKKALRRGIFITFEGVEGCGKSTHSNALYNYLKREGYPCLYTKEPGGTRIGDKIRKILLSPENSAMGGLTELFLFEANRSQIVNEVIRPALKRKMIVICDRFSDATVAYQGYGSGFDISIIKDMNNLATGKTTPDLTVILDIDIEEGLKRTTRHRDKDRMEEKSISYHKRVRRGYINIAKGDPRRVRLIATQKRPCDTQDLIKKEVLGVIHRYKAAG